MSAAFALGAMEAKANVYVGSAEESTLVKFFGEDYENFRKRTPTGIPFIR